MSILPPIGDPAALITTREAWHTIAEHVLAPARHRVTGRIGLRAAPGGFGTPPFGEPDEERVRVDGTQIVVARGTTITTAPITTVAAAAAFVGIPPGAPPDVYPPATPLDPDALLRIDRDAARVLAAWFELGAEVFEELRTAADSSDDPSLVQLWPEHFDLALEIGAKERDSRGTFGASPGDAAHPEPYLYVTRWPGVPDDPFWTEPAFPGVTLGYGAIADAQGRDPGRTAFEFFARAREVLNGAR